MIRTVGIVSESHEIVDNLKMVYCGTKLAVQAIAEALRKN